VAIVVSFGPMQRAPVILAGRCSAHRAIVAGWICRGCEALLCPDCVAISNTFKTVELLQCTRCGDEARPILTRREDLPYATRIREAWRYPLTKSGLLSLAAAGIALSYLFGTLFLAPVGLAIFFGYFFHLVRQTALGSDEIEPPSIGALVADILVPLLRGLVALSVLCGPALLYLHSGRAWDTELLFQDVVLWILCAASILYVPMALMIAATESSVLSLLNPLLVIGRAVDLGRDYLICVAGLAVLLLIQVPLALNVSMTGVLSLFLVGWFGWSVLLYVPFVMARVLGLLLYTRGDAIGFGMPSDYESPLSKERPRGTARPRKDVRARLDQVRAPVAQIASTGFENVVVAPLSVDSRHAPIELEPEPVAAPTPPRAAKRPTLKELDASTLPPLRTHADDE
jgi:hypothetical protein